MATFNLPETQEALETHFKGSFIQPFHETAIPTPETVRRNEAGQIDPYITFQYGDVTDGYSETFGGVETGDFYLPIYFQVVSPEAGISRKLYNKLLETMLGFRTPHGGQVRKGVGGASLPMANDDGTILAYVNPASFKVKVQLFS